MAGLVSVIIPVYNREEIACIAIESVLSQTYRNIEIIIVDDGSTDNSYAKCKEYAEKDGRIILIKKENGGVSSARNTGLDVVRGDYVFFLDSDDFIYNDAIERLVEYAEKFSCDIVQGNKRNMLENENGIKEMVYLEYLQTDIYIPAVWGKLYKSNLLKNIKFDEALIISEDVDFLYRLINHADKIVCCDGSFIATIPTENGLNRIEYGENSLLLIAVLERVIGRLYEISDDKFAKYIYRNYACALFTNYVKAKRYQINNFVLIRKDIQRKYRRSFLQIMKANNGGWRSKLVCIAGWINLDIYRLRV